MNPATPAQRQNFLDREASAPVNTRAHLGSIISSRLCQWVGDCGDSRGPDPDKLGHPRVTAVVAVFDDALSRLDGKTGARADAAREHIRAARAPLAAALELVNGLGAGLDQPLALELQKRIASTRAGLAAALAAKELATRDKIEAALLEVEKSWADIRELDRDLTSVYERLSFPTLKPLLPNLDELLSAKQTTAALEAVPVKRIRAADVHAAIEFAMNAAPNVALLCVAFETQPDHPLIKWRAQALAERPETKAA